MDNKMMSVAMTHRQATALQAVLLSARFRFVRSAFTKQRASTSMMGTDQTVNKILEEVDLIGEIIDALNQSISRTKSNAGIVIEFNSRIIPWVKKLLSERYGTGHLPDCRGAESDILQLISDEQEGLTLAFSTASEPVQQPIVFFPEPKGVFKQ